MTQTVKILRSTTSGNVPVPVSGQIAINEADDLMFWIDPGAVIRSAPLRGKRTQTVASSASVTINSNAVDLHAQTALAAAVTYNAPTGAPRSGQDLWIRILDNGTARAIAWNAAFTSTQGADLPTTTVASIIVYVHFMYNSASSKWEAVSALPMV
jgi:hypothetical protein